MARRSSSNAVGATLGFVAVALVLYLLYQWLKAGGLQTLPGGVFSQSGAAGARTAPSNPFSSLLQKLGLGGPTPGTPARPSSYGASNPFTAAIQGIADFTSSANTTPNFADLGGASLSDYMPDNAAASGISDYQIPTVGYTAPALFDVSQNAQAVPITG